MTAGQQGITVVVPVRDEAGTIATALESLAAQSVGPESIELLVFDGQSADGTARIAKELGSSFPWRRFAVSENPLRTVPHALNAGLAVATGRWFTRLDGRVRLSADYLEACVAAADEAGPFTAAGGRFAAEAHGAVASAIAAAVTHPIGVGQGFRTERGDGLHSALVEVPHHPFAVWRTDDVLRLGGFDAELARNQDDEFSMRATSRGARIFLTTEAEIVYRPRERFRGLAAQYFQYGLWKSAVARRHGLFPLQSAVPALMTMSAAAAGAAAAAGRRRWPALAGCVLYGGLGVVASRRRRGANPLLTGAALGAVHLSYGAGIIAGALAPGLTGTALGQGRVR